MELTWITEKSEKELAALFSCLNFRREVFYGLLLLLVMFVIYCGGEWFRSMLLAASGSLFTVFTVFMCSFMIPCVAVLFGFKIDEIFVRRACRKRKTNRVEYRLTDSSLAFKVGETEFSSPWNKVATHYRLEDDVLFLAYRSFFSNPLGKNPPFEARCIPDWKGSGVKQEELVAALEKAGLKKSYEKLAIWVSLCFCCIVTVVFLSLVWWKFMSESWQNFRWRLSDVELSRTFFQIVGQGEKESENPYFNYWEKHGNFVQRLAVKLTTPFKFEKLEYTFQDNEGGKGRKVGIAATIGDWVLLLDMPSGYEWRVERAKWRSEKAMKIYPSSARAEWLEKVHPLVPELRKAEQDRLTKKIRK